MTELNTAEYLEELAQTLASHGSNLAALRMAELEQKVSPYLAAPGVPSATAGSGGALGGLATAYSPAVAVGGAGLFVKDGAINVQNAGTTVVIDGTSNMFKIMATGTHSGAFPAGTFGSIDYSTQLTALGNGFTTVPAAILMVAYSDSLDLGTIRWGSMWSNIDGTGHVGGLLVAGVYVSSGYVKAHLRTESGTMNFSAYTGYSRYFVLVEAGI